MPVRDSTGIGATGVTSWSISAPTAVNGDRLILIQTTDKPDGMDAPSGGWSLLATAQAFGPGFTLTTQVWTRIKAPGDPSSYTLTQGSGGASVAVSASISGASTATPRVSFQTTTGNAVTTPSVSLPSGTGTDLRYAVGRTTTPSIPDWAWQDEAEDYEPEIAPGTIGGVGAVLLSRTLTAPGPAGTVDFAAAEAMSFSHGITVVIPGDSSGGGDTPPPVSPPTVPALPSGEQVVHYVYEFADLGTDALICKDLDLDDVTYSRRISEPGEFSATLSVTDGVTAAKVARIIPRYPDDLSTGPGRTVVHVYRNGVVWGSYIIWSATVGRSSKGAIQVSISGSSLESYLSHVKIRDDIPYQGWDQIDIARDLIARMQAEPRYDIGLVFAAGTSGVTRDREYLASESSTFGERLAELGNVQNGFEWAIQVIDNGDGTRTRYLVWGAPKLGNAATSHKFMQPGDVESWQEGIDATRGGTAFQARGEAINDDASTTSEPLVSQVILAQAHIDAGWLGLDVTADYSSVSQSDTLDAYAQWWASNRAGAVRVHTATVRLRPNTSFGPGNLGDQVTLMLVNDWWPIVDGVASFARSWRVVGLDFTPPQKGSGQEFCELTFEEIVEEA